MKTAILFYSLSGNTHRWAKAETARRDADLIEVAERSKRGPFGSFIQGCPAAIGRRPSNKLAAPLPDLSGYDTLVLAAPIWAGHPAPPFNNMVAALPADKAVELVFLSGSGNSQKSADATKALVKAQGCRVTAYTDLTPSKT